MKRATIALLCLALITCESTAQQQRVALREGIVIHPTQNVAYVMSPEGGITAVELGSGAVRWTSGTAAKPLALVGNRLVSQVEPKTASAKDNLELAVLNVQERGAIVVRNATDLPDNVRVSVGQTPEGTFSASAQPSGTSAVVNWSFVPAPGPLRGMPPNPQDQTQAETLALEDVRPAPMSGTVRMNLATGAMSGIDTGPLDESPPDTGQTWVIPASEIDASPATQYESADGRHLLTSEAVADDREWNKYRWTVTERDSGRKVGELRTHVSFAPFVVRDSTIVFETTPYMRAGESEPAKLRGFDLATGREEWSVEVREIVYRGPMPP